MLIWFLGFGSSLLNSKDLILLNIQLDFICSEKYPADNLCINMNWTDWIWIDNPQSKYHLYYSCESKQKLGLQSLGFVWWNEWRNRQNERLMLQFHKISTMQIHVWWLWQPLFPLFFFFFCSVWTWKNEVITMASFTCLYPDKCILSS